MNAFEDDLHRSDPRAFIRRARQRSLEAHETSGEVAEPGERSGRDPVERDETGTKASRTDGTETMRVAVEKIGVDPRGQVRTHFDWTAVYRLAANMQQRRAEGRFPQQTPMVLRRVPEEERTGTVEWYIGAGERRWLAMRIIGEPAVDATRDDAFTLADQASENMLREGLTLLELAETVKSSLVEGQSVERVANSLGKAPTQIHKYRRISQAPEVLKALLRSGQCVGENQVQKLIARYEKSPAKVEEWAASVRESGERVTAASIKTLDRIIKGRGPKAQEQGPGDGTKPGTAGKRSPRRRPAKLVPEHQVLCDGHLWTVRTTDLFEMVREDGETRVMSASKLLPRLADEDTPWTVRDGE